MRSITAVNSRTSCKQLLKYIKILYIYILEATYFVKKILTVSGAKLWCS